MRFAALLLAAYLPLCAQFPAVRLHRVAAGFSNPTAVVSAKDGSGRLFVVEQRGSIRVISNGITLATPFLDFTSRVSCCGEQGLLGMAFPPGFTDKQHFYVNYTNRSGDSVISRIRVSGDRNVADPASEQIVLTIAQPFDNHNGGHLEFGPDGFLYIGMGDGGSGGDPQNNGQRNDALLGKMLRIDVESGAATYTVPGSNPFVNRTGYRPEIWATGLRNPWRYSFDRQTGDLWIGDVGQNRAEELNFQAASSAGGENYGWRVMEGLQCFNPSSGCNRTGLTLPIAEYSHDLGCSITAGYVYRGTRWPALAGTFLYSDYCNGPIWGVRRTAAGNEQGTLRSAPGFNVSSFGEDENGELYMVEQGGGGVHIITAGLPSTSAAAVVNAASFQAGLVPGSLATLFGNGITSFGGVVQATGFPLATELAGTSITLNGISAALVAVASVGGQEQINFQVPWELGSADRATLVIRANGQQSDPVEVTLRPAQPEIFTNGGVAVITSGGALVTQAVPVARGSAITIWMTGLGPVTSTPPTRLPARSEPLSLVIAPVEVRFGGQVLTPSFAGLAPGFAGLYQVNVTIPANAPTGTSTLVVTTGGTISKPVALSVR